MAEIVESIKGEAIAYLRRIFFSNQGWIPKISEKLEALSGTDREKISSVCGAALAIYLVFGHFAALVCNVIGFAYPAYASMTAIETEDKADDTQWLTYWTVFAVFSIVDFGAERICGWFPPYWLAKCIFLVYLYEPHFHGAERLYGSCVRPLIRKVHHWLVAGQPVVAAPAVQQQQAAPAQDAPPAAQQAPPPPTP